MFQRVMWRRSGKSPCGWRINSMYAAFPPWHVLWRYSRRQRVKSLTISAGMKKPPVPPSVLQRLFLQNRMPDRVKRYLYSLLEQATVYGAVDIFFRDRKRNERTANGGCKPRRAEGLLGLRPGFCPALTHSSPPPARTRLKSGGPRKETEFDHEKRYPRHPPAFKDLKCYVKRIFLAEDLFHGFE